MKAAQINEYGDASVIQVNEAPRPSLNKNQVLLEVHAASLNPWDSFVRMGRAKDFLPLEFPVTLGGDIAGVILEVGADVTNLAVGDKVYGDAGHTSGSGAFAELAAAVAGQVAKMPTNLDFTQAASLPLVGVSAVQVLTDHLKLAAGQKIFIHGGAGGIGTVAIQIAKGIGAYVAVTATGDAIDYVKQLGADEVIDYKAEDFTTKLSGYDAVFDTVGGDDFNKSLTILKKGGVAVSMTAKADATKLAELGVTAITQTTHVTSSDLNALTKLVEDGTVTPQIGQTFPLEQVREAFEARESGKVRGKIVVKIQ